MYEIFFIGTFDGLYRETEGILGWGWWLGVEGNPWRFYPDTLRHVERIRWELLQLNFSERVIVNLCREMAQDCQWVAEHGRNHRQHRLHQERKDLCWSCGGQCHRWALIGQYYLNRLLIGQDYIITVFWLVNCCSVGIPGPGQSWDMESGASDKGSQARVIGGEREDHSVWGQGQ